MANTKISALTSATTPLAGTETLPIVQGGTTKKITVATITGSGLYPGSFTTLASTGNTTLGDASTDTVQINGYAGVGVAPNAQFAVSVSGSALTGTIQVGVNSFITGSSAATTSIRSFSSLPSTAAAAFTVTDVYGYYANNATKGAGSTITNQHGLYIADQTQGTNNYGITSLVSSGTNKWNIYASGTAANYFAGNVGVNVTNPDAAVDVLALASNAQGLRIRGRTADDIGSIQFRNNTGVVQQGVISSRGSTYEIRYYAGTGALAEGFHTFHTSNSERMRIDSAGNVGVGTTANASAILDAQSTTKGVRMPNMTTAQKNAIALPAAGLMVFDTTLAKLCVYSGAAWQTITSI